MPSIYIETSVISFLRAKAASHVVSAARQIVTKQWWERERESYNLFISQAVLEEASQGNQALAAERLAHLEGLPVLELTDGVLEIATTLLSRTVLPEKAKVDAIHVSAAAFYGVDYLLTWNCTHIANARLIPRVNAVLAELGYTAPYICTPDELLGHETEYT